MILTCLLTHDVQFRKQRGRTDISETSVTLLVELQTHLGIYAAFPTLPPGNLSLFILKVSNTLLYAAAFLYSSRYFKSVL